MARREKALADALRTAEGTELLRALEAEFYDCDLMGATPEETAFKLGARQVVVFMREARDRAVKS
jgi:hypothetical protein